MVLKLLYIVERNNLDPYKDEYFIMLLFVIFQEGMDETHK